MGMFRRSYDTCTFMKEAVISQHIRDLLESISRALSIAILGCIRLPWIYPQSLDDVVLSTR